MKTNYRALNGRLNGRLTARSQRPFSYEVAKTQEGSNHWSSTENSRSGARVVYFGNGYAGNGTKYYGFVIRAVTAFTFTA